MYILGSRKQSNSHASSVLIAKWRQIFSQQMLQAQKRYQAPGRVNLRNVSSKWCRKDEDWQVSISNFWYLLWCIFGIARVREPVNPQMIKYGIIYQNLMILAGRCITQTMTGHLWTTHQNRLQNIIKEQLTGKSKRLALQNCSLCWTSIFAWNVWCICAVTKSELFDRCICCIAIELSDTTSEQEQIHKQLNLICERTRIGGYWDKSKQETILTFQKKKTLDDIHFKYSPFEFNKMVDYLIVHSRTMCGLYDTDLGAKELHQICIGVWPVVLKLERCLMVYDYITIPAIKYMAVAFYFEHYYTLGVHTMLEMRNKTFWNSDINDEMDDKCMKQIVCRIKQASGKAIDYYNKLIKITPRIDKADPEISIVINNLRKDNQMLKKIKNVNQLRFQWITDKTEKMKSTKIGFGYHFPQETSFFMAQFYKQVFMSFCKDFKYSMSWKQYSQITYATNRLYYQVMKKYCANELIDKHAVPGINVFASKHFKHRDGRYYCSDKCKQMHRVNK